ncbi:hypothetical protein [Lactobacillus helveticus]|uniref:hypothetical protein n=1 Tax=Lactobacillus helveticus TaxID=1587 RepID=UPI00187BC01E|nr:hypothetical protein [Lactobacillus helveticus]
MNSQEVKADTKPVSPEQSPAANEDKGEQKQSDAGAVQAEAETVYPNAHVETERVETQDNQAANVQTATDKENTLKVNSNVDTSAITTEAAKEEKTEASTNLDNERTFKWTINVELPKGRHYADGSNKQSIQQTVQFGRTANIDQTIKGKLGEHIPVKLEIPAGWKLAKGVDAPTSVVITQDDDTPITIALDKIVKPDSGKPTGGDKHEGGKPGTGQQGGNHNEGGTGSQGSGNSDQGNISGGTTGSTSSTTSSTTAATGTDTKTATAASQSDASSDDSDLDDEDYDDDSGDVEAPRHHKSGKSRSSRRAAASASAAPAAAARPTAAASCYASNIGPHGQSSTAGSSSNIAPNGEALPDGQSINAKGQVLDAKGQVIGYVYKKMVKFTTTHFHKPVKSKTI